MEHEYDDYDDATDDALEDDEPNDDEAEDATDDGALENDEPADESGDDRQMEESLDDVRFGSTAGINEDTGNTVSWSNSYQGYYDDKTWHEVTPK